MFQNVQNVKSVNQTLTQTRFLFQNFNFHFLIPLQQSRSLDVYEVALNFADAVHGGDRRKKSQQCPFDDRFDFRMLAFTFSHIVATESQTHMLHIF